MPQEDEEGEPHEQNTVSQPEKTTEEPLEKIENLKNVDNAGDDLKKKEEELIFVKDWFYVFDKYIMVFFEYIREQLK